MKVIIAGCRDTHDPLVVWEAIKASGFQITEVVSGAARGIDTLGEAYAKAAEIPCVRFPADWSKGKAAGPIRNQQMADYAEALIAIPSAKSIGTYDMIRRAQAKNLQVYVHPIGNP